jgi:hypothetical protein
MQTLVERGCGLDVHQATVVECLLHVKRDGRVQKQMRNFGTTTRALVALEPVMPLALLPLASQNVTPPPKIAGLLCPSARLRPQDFVTSFVINGLRRFPARRSSAGPGIRWVQSRRHDG